MLWTIWRITVVSANSLNTGLSQLTRRKTAMSRSQILLLWSVSLNTSCKVFYLTPWCDLRFGLLKLHHKNVEQDIQEYERKSNSTDVQLCWSFQNVFLVSVCQISWQIFSWPFPQDVAMILTWGAVALWHLLSVAELFNMITLDPCHCFSVSVNKGAM